MSEVTLEAVTDESFEDMVLKSSTPVVVDFWAEWCGPCKQIAPIFEGCALDYSGKVKFLKMDVSSNKGIPAKYNIRGIPTIMLFVNGENVATHVGGDLSKPSLASFIDSNL